MTALLVSLAAILLIVVGLLAIPVRLSLQAERADRVRVVWRVRWIFGLVDVGSRRRPGRADGEPAPAAAPARETKTAEEAPTQKRPKKAKRRRRGWRAVLRTLRTPGLVPRVTRLLTGLLRRIRFDSFRLRAEYGFDDPADTGRTYAVVTPLVLLASARGLDVDVRAVFVDERLRGSCETHAHVRPLSVVGTLLAFVLAPPVLRAAHTWWKAGR